MTDSTRQATYERRDRRDVHGKRFRAWEVRCFCGLHGGRMVAGALVRDFPTKPAARAWFAEHVRATHGHLPPKGSRVRVVVPNTSISDGALGTVTTVHSSDDAVTVRWDVEHWDARRGMVRTSRVDAHYCTAETD